jgi:hypothetical protein
VKLYQLLEQLDSTQPATFMGWALATPADVESLARQALGDAGPDSQRSNSARAVVRSLDANRVLAMRSQGAHARALRELDERWREYSRQYRDELSGLPETVPTAAREAARAANNEACRAFLLASASSTSFASRARDEVRRNATALRCNWFRALAGDVAQAAPPLVYLLQSVMGIAAEEVEEAERAERAREAERRRLEAARRHREREARRQQVLRGFRGAFGGLVGGALGVPLGLIAAVVAAIPVFLALAIPGLILYFFDVDIFEPVWRLLVVLGPIVGVVVGAIVGASASTSLAVFWTMVLIAAAGAFLAFQNRPVVVELARDWAGVGREVRGWFGSDTPQGAGPPAASAPSSNAQRPAVTNGANWKISINGVGPIKVGTPLTEAHALLNRSLGSASVSPAGSAYVATAPGIAVVPRQGRVAAVKSNGAWRTLSGVGVGDRMARVPDTYGDKVHRVDIQGIQEPAYVYVPRDEKDAELRLVFRSSPNGQIESICVGRLADVAWICEVDAGAMAGISPRRTTDYPETAAAGRDGGELDERAIRAFLDETRPGWRTAALPAGEASSCARAGEALSNSVEGDFDGNGSMDFAMLIASVDPADQRDRVELILLRDGRHWDFLAEMPRHTTALLGVLPRGSSVVTRSVGTEVLSSDGLMVARCDGLQQRYFFVHSGSGWSKQWLSDISR